MLDVTFLVGFSYFDYFSMQLLHFVKVYLYSRVYSIYQQNVGSQFARKQLIVCKMSLFLYIVKELPLLDAVTLST
jgi:hypothetical protein